MQNRRAKVKNSSMRSPVLSSPETSPKSSPPMMFQPISPPAPIAPAPPSMYGHMPVNDSFTDTASLTFFDLSPPPATGSLQFLSNFDIEQELFCNSDFASHLQTTV